jgi:hypothetical protein
MPIFSSILSAILGYFAVNIGYSFALGGGISIKSILNALFASVFLPIWAVKNAFSSIPIFLAVVGFFLLCGLALSRFEEKNRRYVIFVALMLLEITGAYAAKSLAV